MRALFSIMKTRYKKVLHPALPATPTQNRSFVLIGQNFKERPPLLDQYIRGGYSFSERRRQEIKNFIFKPNEGGIKKIRERENNIENFFNKIFKNEIFKDKGG